MHKDVQTSQMRTYRNVGGQGLSSKCAHRETPKFGEDGLPAVSKSLSMLLLLRQRDQWPCWTNPNRLCMV